MGWQHFQDHDNSASFAAVQSNTVAFETNENDPSRQSISCIIENLDQALDGGVVGLAISICLRFRLREVFDQPFISFNEHSVVVEIKCSAFATAIEGSNTQESCETPVPVEEENR